MAELQLVTNVCLNPQTHHPVADTARGNLVCAVPACGFLVAGALIDSWQVSVLLRQGELFDLYLATNRNDLFSGRSGMLVRVIKQANPQALVQLKNIFSMQHPAIHPLIKVGWTGYGKQLFLLSPFEERGSLARFVGSESHLALPILLSFVRQIVDALNYAHAHNIVHGRLKPENCLITTPKTIQVADFFYASPIFMDKQRAVTAVLAPEQLLARKEPATDQYELALLIYRLLSGKHPFPGSMAGQEPYVPLSFTRPDLPHQLDQVLELALAPLPEHRFYTLESFFVALQSALNLSISSASLEETSLGVNSQNLNLDQRLMPKMPSLPLPRVEFAMPQQVESLCRLAGHSAPVEGLCWAASGNNMVSLVKQSLHFWRINQRGGVPIKTVLEKEGHMLSVHWSSDNMTVATTTTTGMVRLWNNPYDMSSLTTPRSGWHAHEGRCSALSWSADAARLLTGGDDGYLRFWDASTGKNIGGWRAHAPGGITAVEWLPDNRLVASGGEDHLIHIWRASNGARQATCRAHTDEIRALAWSPDGSLLASYAGPQDLRICLWNSRTGELLAECTGPQGEVKGLFWAADGSWCAAISLDGLLHCWATRSPQGQIQSQTIALPGIPVAAAYLTEQKKLAVALSDRLVYILRLS
ncbi:protein kinase family protein [Dictyobacter arantiisoli]|uniref:Protein kinase domain-containing protein n=1 Tax=Dictyobacter arantiisoli TaxID=2014874 RepID=A0A5A5TD44_9CHLR|nr:WD40 repeat domain-containing serine/threonine-protein kinase [Dictyobacter arantiisoli]GCF09451.1 hypothetical protein KDI_30150 [Dictyobacter arantiisoli]